MFRILLYILGIILTSIGLFFIIIYLNLLTIGYSFSDYVNFIIRRPEFYYLIVGFIILTLTIILSGGEKYELYL